MKWECALRRERAGSAGKEVCRRFIGYLQLSGGMAGGTAIPASLSHRSCQVIFSYTIVLMVVKKNLLSIMLTLDLPCVSASFNPHLHRHTKGGRLRRYDIPASLPPSRSTLETGRNRSTPRHAGHQGSALAGHAHCGWSQSEVLGLFSNNLGSWPLVVKRVSHGMLPLHSGGNAICRTLPGALPYPGSRPVAGTPGLSLITAVVRHVTRQQLGTPPPVPAGVARAAAHVVGPAGSDD
jgi:hypothetical protein